jgi:CheY-like chemotaxis protein
VAGDVSCCCGTVFFTLLHLSPLFMKNASSIAGITTQEAVEVKFLETYLLHNRNILFSTLSAYALDKGPVPVKESAKGSIAFRFMKYDWERTIGAMLASQSIPFEMTRCFRTDVFQEMARKKVYVAEDDLNILFALDTMLEDAGYEVILSHCGAPMLEAYLPQTDLFILDNRMPDVNGIDVCRHLKRQATTQYTPVIMISAIRNFKAQAIKAGVDDFLEKPFHMQELLRLVSKHTQYRRQLA